VVEEGLNELELLSPEDIIKGLHLEVDKVIAEAKSLHPKIDEVSAKVESPREVFYEFLEEFCEPHTENRVWSEMLKGRGAYSVSETARRVHLSISQTYKIMDRLRVRGLVKMIGNRYQAVSPEAFIREKRTQRRKSIK